MLRNLAALHRDSGDLPRLWQVQQRQVVLEPQDDSLRRAMDRTRTALGQPGMP
jgi:hypothetical protein